MAYTKKTWADGSAGNTPITAAELNRMEDGIDEAVNGTDTVEELFYADGQIVSGATALNTDLVPLGIRVPFATTLRQFVIRLTPARVSGGTTFVVRRSGVVIATTVVPVGATTASSLPNIVLLEGDILNIQASADASTAATTAVAATLSSATPPPYSPLQAPGALHWWSVAAQTPTTDVVFSPLTDSIGTRSLASATSAGPIMRINGFASGKRSIEYNITGAKTQNFGQATSNILNGLNRLTVATAFKSKSGESKGFLIGKGFTLQLGHQADGTFQILVGNSAGTGWAINANSTAVSFDAIHSMTFTLNGTNAILRVDGATIYSGAFTAALPSNTSGFAIGAANELSAEPYTGLIGDVFVGNQALEGADLSALENYMRSSAGLATL